MATVLGCGLFAAVCGSSLATAVTMGKVAFPEMLKFKYAASLATGCIAAGGSLGMMIPPSMAFVLLGVLTDVSIGKLFIAGILPGITQILFYCIAVYVVCKLNPGAGPAGPKTTLVEKTKAVKGTWSVAILFLLVMGGIYGGIFTAEEAGAVGACGALVIALASRSMSRKTFTQCLMDTARTTAMIMCVIIGAYIFMRFLAVTRIPFIASDFVASLGLNRWLYIGIILVVFVVLGMFFDMIAVVSISTPILFPIITSLGFDPIWYCVLMVREIETGFVSPPYGINLFAVAGSTQTPIATVYKGVIPFFIADIANLLLLAAVPQISTFLPYLMIAK